MVVTGHITTAEQLERAGDIGRCELVHGALRMMTPAGGPHGQLTNELAFRLTAHVKRNSLGGVFAAETGFVLARNPDTVRAPDIAFIRKDRQAIALSKGFVPGAPDLAVEVLSPGDFTEETLAKVQEWLDGGALMVWVVNPRNKSIAVYKPDGAARVLNEGDTLRGDPVVEGFELPLAELFAELSG
jgi:Uma2 family endonuclease